MSRQWRQR